MLYNSPISFEVQKKDPLQVPEGSIYREKLTLGCADFSPSRLLACFATRREKATCDLCLAATCDLIMGACE